MKTTLLIVLTCFGWVSIGATTPDSHRKKLTQPTVIQGYSCAKRYAFFYADGKLDNCAVNRETQYGEALIPRGSIIYLTPDGSLWGVGLAHSTRIHDVLCGGGGFLGPAEGSETAFYPSGKLHQCYLAKNQVVQGVPCAQRGCWHLFMAPTPDSISTKTAVCVPANSRRISAARRKTRSGNRLQNRQSFRAGARRTRGRGRDAFWRAAANGAFSPTTSTAATSSNLTRMESSMPAG